MIAIIAGLSNFLTMKNLKIFLIVGLALTAVWFYKDYTKAKEDIIVYKDNAEQIRKYDSLKYASQTYSKKEMAEYLEYNRADLTKFLKDQKIATNRIERIITQRLKYSDTAKRSTDLQPILDAIKNQRDIKVPIIDSTDCLIIKGFVVFANDTLSLDITDRQFTNTTDVISYWERNQWKLLGIKTRLFGRKSATVIIKDDCGNTKTFVVNKKK